MLRSCLHLAILQLRLHYVLSKSAWSVTSIPLVKLRDENYSQVIRDTLALDGLLFVSDIPHFAAASSDAFATFEQCKERTVAATNQGGVFSNFVVRRLGTRNDEGRLEDTSLENRRLEGTDEDTEGPSREDAAVPCDMHRTRTFRTLVHQTGADVAAALGPSAVEFIRTGAHKEQFHRYASDHDRLPMHTDAGVLLAMTSTVLDEGVPNALSVVTPLGDTVEVDIPPHTILIMAGEGFNMSQSLLGVKLRAVPHAPVISRDVTARLWYGEMFLPSEDFYIRPNIRMRDWVNTPNAATIGCMSSGRQLKDARVDCGPNSSLCWMQCIPSNYTCRNISSGGICEPLASHMNPDCREEIQSAHKPFCTNGMATDMFMQGFVSILFGSADNGCLAFFFGSLVIDSYFKFFLAFLAYVAIGMSSEALIYFRRKQARRATASRAWALAAYAGNVSVGYLVMLGAMTYALEIFAAVILGLTLGHAMFSLGDSSVRFSATTACCAGRGTPYAPQALSDGPTFPAGSEDRNRQGAYEGVGMGLNDPLVEQLILHVEGHNGRISLMEETICSVEGVTECIADCCDSSRVVVHTNGNVAVHEIRDRLAELNIRCQLPI